MLLLFCVSARARECDWHDVAAGPTDKDRDKLFRFDETNKWVFMMLFRNGCGVGYTVSRRRIDHRNYVAIGSDVEL